MLLASVLHCSSGEKDVDFSLAKGMDFKLTKLLYIGLAKVNGTSKETNPKIKKEDEFLEKNSTSRGKKGNLF